MARDMLPILPPVVIFGAQALVAMTPQTLWQEWPEQRFVSAAAPCLRHADLAFNVLQDDRAAVGCQDGTRQGSKIFEIGDGRFIAAARDVDARGRVAVKGWSARAWIDGVEVRDAR